MRGIFSAGQAGPGYAASGRPDQIAVEDGALAGRAFHLYLAVLQAELADDRALRAVEAPGVDGLKQAFLRQFLRLHHGKAASGLALVAVGVIGGHKVVKRAVGRRHIQHTGAVRAVAVPRVGGGAVVNFRSAQVTQAGKRGKRVQRPRGMGQNRPAAQLVAQADELLRVAVVVVGQDLVRNADAHQMQHFAGQVVVHFQAAQNQHAVLHMGGFAGLAVIGHGQKIIAAAAIELLAFLRRQPAVAAGGMTMQIAFEKRFILTENVHPE